MVLKIGLSYASIIKCVISLILHENYKTEFLYFWWYIGSKILNFEVLGFLKKKVFR